MQLRTLKVDGETVAVNCDIAIAEGIYIEIHRYDKNEIFAHGPLPSGAMITDSFIDNMVENGKPIGI